MASRALPGSTSSRLASTGLSRFFFQPVELELKLTDLLVQSCLKALLVFRPFGAAVGEDLRQPFYGLLFPTRDLIRMYTKPACQLGDRAFAADRRQRHLGLKCLGKCPSLLCHEFTSWSFINSSSANPPYSRARKSPTIIDRHLTLRLAKKLGIVHPHDEEGPLCTPLLDDDQEWAVEDE